MDTLNSVTEKELVTPKKKNKVKGESNSKQISIQIKDLLKEYNTLTKKSLEGKGIRKKLRKLGYYLSQNKVKKNKSKKDKE